MNTQNIPADKEAVESVKLCKHCGQKIKEASVICPYCGCQAEELKSQTTPQIVINNVNSNENTNFAVPAVGRLRNKWTAFCLCLLLGIFGGHKFYEGKAGMGVLYLFTGGLFGIGWIIDIISILCKPNPYYVY